MKRLVVASLVVGAIVPNRPVALVLGTSARVADDRDNLFFHHRMRAAADLYRSGKVRHLLVSGDNGRKAYDEASDMRDALVALGVPESAITRDYAGLRTLDSVVRCRRVFGQTSVVIVSLRFHAERALYLARSEAVADTTVGRSPRYLGDPVRIGES